MAKKMNIGAGIALDGEKEFRQAISGINSDMKLLSSEMKLTSQNFSENANSVDALRSKDELLNKQIDKQKEKVEALRLALENSKNTYGETDTKTDAWKISLNNAETELSKLDKELKTNNKYLDEAKTSTNGVASSIDNYGKEIKTAGDSTLKTGDIIKANLTSQAIISGVAALGSAIGNAATKTVELAVSAASYADDMMTMSTQTGVSTDKLQAYNYMAELTDVSLEDMTNSMAKNIKSMSNAQSGSEKYVDAYKKLKVEFEDGNGKLRDSEEVYWDVVDALSGITDETERDTISMQLFGKSAQTLNPLIAQGSEGVKKLTDEAKSMGAVLSGDTLTALGKTDDALQRMYQSVDIAKRKFGAEMAPEMTEAVEKITLKISDMDGELAEMAGGALSAVTDGLVWVMDNSDLVVAGLTGIGAAMATQATVSAINGVVQGYKDFKLAMEGATIAQSIFNGVANANPLGLVATALVGLGTAMVVYTATQKKTTTEFSRLEEKIKDVRDENLKLADEIDNSQTNFSDNTDAIENNYGAVQLLSDKLYDLSDNESKTNAEKAQMQVLVGQLNESIPNLNLVMNEQTGILSLQKGEVDSLVQSMKEKALAQAYEERYLEIAKEQASAQERLTAATETQSEAQEKYNEASEKYWDAMKKHKDGDSWSGVYDASDELKKFEEDLKSASDEVNSANITLDECETKFDTLDDTIGITSKTTSDYADTTKDSMSDASEAITEAAKEEAAALKKLQEKYLETKTSATESIESQLGLFDKFSAKVKITNKEILENLKTQVEGVRNWSTNIATLAKKGVDEGLLQELRDMGTEGAGYVAELTTMSDSEIAKLNKLWAEKLDIVDAVATEFADATMKAETSGGYFAEGFANGVSRKAYLAKLAAQNMAKDTMKTLDNTLEIKSPSKKGVKSGGYYSEGVAVGITESSKLVKIAIDDMADIVLTGADKKKKTATEVGEEMLSIAKITLDNYKVYNDISLEDEAAYWNEIRKECKKGTQARVDADKNYFDAKKASEEAQTELLEKQTKARNEILTSQVKTVIEALKKQKEAQQTYRDECKKINAGLVTDAQSATDNYNNAVESRTKSITSSTGLFDSFSANKTTSGQELLSNLASQVRGISEWSSNLDKLKNRGISDGLLTELQEMGVKASGEITALNTLTDAELENYVGLWESKTRLAKEQSLKELVGLKDETTVKISELSTQANKDLKSYYTGYVAAMKELGVAIKEPINQVKVTIGEDGKVVVENITKAMKNEATSQNTSSSLKITTDAILFQMKSMAAGAIGIGQYFAQGLAVGMKSQQSIVSLASAGLVVGAIAGARIAGGIHSPSKKTAELVGLPLAQGIGVGFTNAMTGITNEMTNAIPTSFNTDVNMNGAYNMSTNPTSNSGNSDFAGIDYSKVATAFVSALNTFCPQVILDREKVGDFVMNKINMEVIAL